MKSFIHAKQEFDTNLGKKTILENAFVPVDGKPKEKNEEYYKWQFIYALINSGLYPKDYIGVEIRFPKGSRTSAPLKIDGAIFDDAIWILHYKNFWNQKKTEDLEWMNSHLIAIIEFKKDDKEIEKVFAGQIKPAMKEKDPSDAYILGIYYNSERLYLFHRKNGQIIRYDEAKNQKGETSKVGDLSLHLPDPYIFIPSFKQLKAKVHKPSILDISKRRIEDLDIITSITTIQIKNALSEVLRTLDKVNLADQRGYEILIKTFALKIFDEKRNKKNINENLDFYITNEEFQFKDLSEKSIQEFISRMRKIWSQAEGKYQKILENKVIDWKKKNHVRAVAEICKAFQNFSFNRSSESDLYQLVFYNFANYFKRNEAAQFLTPFPIIKFIVEIVNPLNGETVFDPCCGIADFLSLSYVNSQKKDEPYRLDDTNIYGVDLDENMIMLATLNMLLNGDGEAKLFKQEDLGSILFKVTKSDPPKLVELIPDYHKNGNWDNWKDNTKLFKFDVILTNPPFGEDRAFSPKSQYERKVIEMYETWNILENPKNIDLGIIFLENAYQCLKEEGRFGIILSNSIASINRWQKIRQWLLERMRLVACFDLPPNVFAETGVNTTIIVAYKPKKMQLKELNEYGYSIFLRDIHNVGYEKRTNKRNVFFNPIYIIDESTFEIMTNKEGMPIVKEDFTQTLEDFRQWALGQEETLQKLFLKGL